MSSTYQPSAKTPELERVGHDLQMNVPDTERLASGAAGAALVSAGFARGGVARWALLIAGGALIRRAVTGRCPLYRQLALDRRHGRPGVPGNRGVRIEAAVEIRCPAAPLFQYWRNLEQLPGVMRHVKSVQQHDSKRSHWKVAGPAGQTLEWDAEIINEEQDRMLAWRSLPGGSVRNAGSVWFEPTDSGKTRVKVAMEFDPPAGAVGAAIAGLLGNSPERDLAEDLERFKEFAEKELARAPGE